MNKRILMKRVVMIITSFIFLTLMQIETAYAYVDPGSGLLIWQIIISMLVGFVFFFKKIINYILGKRDKKG